MTGGYYVQDHSLLRQDNIGWYNDKYLSLMVRWDELHTPHTAPAFQTPPELLGTTALPHTWSLWGASPLKLPFGLKESGCIKLMRWQCWDRTRGLRRKAGYWGTEGRGGALGCTVPALTKYETWIHIQKPKPGYCWTVKNTNTHANAQISYKLELEVQIWREVIMSQDHGLLRQDDIG